MWTDSGKSSGQDPGKDSGEDSGKDSGKDSGIRSKKLVTWRRVPPPNKTSEWGMEKIWMRKKTMVKRREADCGVISRSPEQV